MKLDCEDITGQIDTPPSWWRKGGIPREHAKDGVVTDFEKYFKWRRNPAYESDYKNGQATRGLQAKLRQRSKPKIQLLSSQSIPVEMKDRDKTI